MYPGDEAVPAKDRRLSFGGFADDYDHYRPTYPRAAVEWALGTTPLRVGDLGAGTGSMSRLLADCGHDVIAIEPDPRMRRSLEQAPDPRITVRAGSAESIPVADGTLDALVAAASFHWFDLPKALPEMARALRPGGTVAIAWNHRDDDVDWVEQMSQILGRLDARSGTRELIVPPIVPPFVDLEVATFHHTQLLDNESLVGLAGTFSHVALSPRRDDLLRQIRALVASHPSLAGQACFELPYETVMHRARTPTGGHHSVASRRQVR
jgi:SAM-dependent methyltransferase